MGKTYSSILGFVALVVCSSEAGEVQAQGLSLGIAVKGTRSQESLIPVAFIYCYGPQDNGSPGIEVSSAENCPDDQQPVLTY